MTTRIAHISDTHFGTEIPEVLAALNRIMAELSPDVVILSGDITQRALTSQFRAARAFMDGLHVPHKIIVPGNHDIPLYHFPIRLLLPYHRYDQQFQEREGSWGNEDVAILSYNATSRWRHTQGYLSANRIEAGFEQSAHMRSPEKITMIVAHQPLAVKWSEDIHNLLIDAKATAELLAEKGADIVLSGHLHVPLCTTTHHAYPALARHMVLAGAGTAISHRTRRNLPNSFYLITCHRAESGTEKQIQVISYDYDTASGSFCHALQHRFQANAHTWQEI
jgi:3',5'-cyclic AMP phosphodiesterase CpdA